MNDGMTKSSVFLPYYKTPGVWIMKHCFPQGIKIRRPTDHSFCWPEASGSSLSTPPLAALSWKVDDDQSMPLNASNSASSSINPAGSTSGAKVCLQIGGIKLIAS